MGVSATTDTFGRVVGSLLRLSKTPQKAMNGYFSSTLPPGESGATVGVSAASPDAYTEEGQAKLHKAQGAYCGVVGGKSRSRAA